MRNQNSQKNGIVYLCILACVLESKSDDEKKQSRNWVVWSYMWIELVPKRDAESSI